MPLFKIVLALSYIELSAVLHSESSFADTQWYSCSWRLWFCWLV